VGKTAQADELIRQNQKLMEKAALADELDSCSKKNQELLAATEKVASAAIKATDEHAWTLEEMGRLRDQLAASEMAQHKAQDSLTITQVLLQESEGAYNHYKSKYKF
jgi:hypothetical protein